MTEWISLEDKEAWGKRPNKYKLLYPDGTIQKVIIYGNAECATLQFDEPTYQGEPTHWSKL